MTLGVTWSRIEDAAAKYSLDVPLILKWVEEGVVRAEQDGKRVVRVHIDDLELKMQERSGF